MDNKSRQKNKAIKRLVAVVVEGPVVVGLLAALAVEWNVVDGVALDVVALTLGCPLVDDVDSLKMDTEIETEKEGL